MRNVYGIYYHAKVRNERSLGCFGLFCVLQDLPDTDKVSIYVLSAFAIRFFICALVIAVRFITQWYKIRTAIT